MQRREMLGWMAAALAGLDIAPEKVDRIIGDVEQAIPVEKDSTVAAELRLWALHDPTHTPYVCDISEVFANAGALDFAVAVPFVIGVWYDGAQIEQKERDLNPGDLAYVRVSPQNGIQIRVDEIKFA